MSELSCSFRMSELEEGAALILHIFLYFSLADRFFSCATLHIRVHHATLIHKGLQISQQNKNYSAKAWEHTSAN